jgi:hypothetical protein
MAEDGPDHLVLRHLREIDRKQDMLLERLDNLANRVSSLETVLGLCGELERHLERPPGRPRPPPGAH